MAIQELTTKKSIGFLLRLHCYCFVVAAFVLARETVPLTCVFNVVQAPQWTYAGQHGVSTFQAAA